MANTSSVVQRGALDGRRAVVLGGSGGVGVGVVRELLRCGASVVATGRDRARLDVLAKDLDGAALRTAVLDTAAPGLARDVTELAAGHGPIDLLVVSVASWGDQGRIPLLEITDDQFDALLAANLTAVFRCYRAFWPVLALDAVVVQLNGMSAEIPFPGAAGRALTAAAVKSMTRTLAAETASSGRRVHEILLGVVRTAARQAQGVDDESWLTGEEIGAHVADLAAGTSPLVSEVLQYYVDRSGPRASSSAEGGP